MQTRNAKKKIYETDTESLIQRKFFLQKTKSETSERKCIRQTQKVYLTESFHYRKPNTRKKIYKTATENLSHM